jgi:hypothetical protein
MSSSDARVAIGDVRGGTHNSSGFVPLGAIYKQATHALLILGALAGAMQLLDAGQAVRTIELPATRAKARSLQDKAFSRV